MQKLKKKIRKLLLIKFQFLGSGLYWTQDHVKCKFVLQKTRQIQNAMSTKGCFNNGYKFSNT